MVSQPLRGRDEQTAVISDALREASRGRGSLLLVEASAGFGKSSLLEWGITTARGADFRVGYGRVEPGDEAVPMGPLFAALFDGPQPLIELASSEALQDLPTQRYWLIEELAALLERAAEASALLVCIDDAQWLDAGSLAVLRALTLRLADRPVVWLVATRPSEVQVDLRAAADELAGASSLLALGPLDEAAVAAVTADLTGAYPDAALADLLHRAVGNPYLLVELLHGLLDEGLVDTTTGVAGLTQNRLPTRISQSMRLRIDRMSAHAQSVAKAASVLGRSFTFQQISAFLDLPPLTLVAPVDELLREDLFAETGQTLHWRHDLTRDAVRAALPASALRALQRQAVDTLLATGSSPAEVAVQLAECAEPGDTAAVVTLQLAARALAATDPGAAADLCQRALALARVGDPVHSELVAETVLLLHAAGRIEDGKVFADRELREALTAEQEANVLLSIANMFGLSADLRSEASARALLLPGISPTLRARHAACLVHSKLAAARTEDGRALLPAARTHAAVTADSAAGFALGLGESFLLYQDGHYADALDAVDVAIRAGASLGDTGRLILAMNSRVETLSVLDRFDEALTLTAANLARARGARQTWGALFFDGSRGRRLLQVGKLDDAAASLEGAVDAASRASSMGVLDAAAAAALGQVAIHTGNERLLELCLAYARAAQAIAVPAVQHHAALLSALSAWADGDTAGAHRNLRSAVDREGGLIARFPADVTDEVMVARIAREVGDHELCAAAVGLADARLARNPGVGSIVGVAAHTRGLVEQDAAALQAAIDIFAAGGRPVATAVALEDAGALAAREGRPDDAIALLTRSLETFARCGASQDAQRVRRRLHGLGVRRRLVAEPRPLTGWASLTTSEIEVARLVAHGLTNREVAETLFVSTHTVSSHLRSCFAKLGINSRVELARSAARMATTTPA